MHVLLHVSLGIDWGVGGGSRQVVCSYGIRSSVVGVVKRLMCEAPKSL